MTHALLSRLRRATPAFWLALLALVVASSGAAYAATVVTTKEVKDRSLLGKDLAKNTVTGAEVKESTLTLPALGGAVIRRISYAKPGFEPNGGTQVLSLDGLTLRASCDAGSGIITLRATSQVPAAEISWVATDADSNPQSTSGFADSFGSGQAKTLTFGDAGDQIGHLRYVTDAGAIVVVELVAEDEIAPCTLRGWAIGDAAVG